jgi:hypothetical protein
MYLRSTVNAAGSVAASSASRTASAIVAICDAIGAAG